MPKDTPECIKLSVSVPKETVAAGKAVARSEGRSFSNYVTRAVEADLTTRKLMPNSRRRKGVAA
jgi:hypothetical protein